jgi:hypothetical protein
MNEHVTPAASLPGAIGVYSHASVVALTSEAVWLDPVRRATSWL